MSGDDVEPATRRRTAAEWLQLVRRLEREGELFGAYDAARQALQHFPDDIALKHRVVLCLASTGATLAASEQFAAYGLAEAADDPGSDAPLAIELAALNARLLKDRALAAAPETRVALLAAAAEAYEAAYLRACEAGYVEAYYPGVNCATLRLLAGDKAGGARLAREILDQLAGWPASRKGYFEIATELEALLVVGDAAGARDKARQFRRFAARRRRPDYRGLASTIHQTRLVIGAGDVDFDVSRELAPPRVIHYVGHIISPPGERGRFPAAEEASVAAKIAAALDAAPPGFAFGSLAAGADILFAEALLDRHASLHIVLPFAVEEFVDVSVRPAGGSWVDRFERCYKRAATTHFATDDRYLGDDSLFGYCSQLAMGLAVLRARHLCADLEQIAVWDGNPPSGAAGTAADMALWKGTGLPQTTIRIDAASGFGAANGRGRPRAAERRTCAMLFGDVKGFSRLKDEELPRFVEVVLGRFAMVLERFVDDIRFANTWGDGLFIVFDDAGKAAACALDLQDAMRLIDLAGSGLPDHLALRLGGHLGPAYRAADPILKRANFFGAHVSRAARIEPVTPENLVYVTEPLAAVLALHNAEEFTCQYVGMTKAAKEYGQMPMFLLGRNTG
jgi:class 3 adenylate cyclase